MFRSLLRACGAGVVAATLALSGAAAASAADSPTTWTLTSCSSSSFTYTSPSGAKVTTAASVGATFVGTEMQLAQAVAEVMTSEMAQIME